MSLQNLPTQGRNGARRILGQRGFWSASLLLLAILVGFPAEPGAQAPSKPIELDYEDPNSFGRLEEGEAIKFVVKRVGDTAQALTVSVRVEGKSDEGNLQRFNPTDASDFDFSKSTTSLTFASGSTVSQTITIQSNQDTIYEPEERFHVVVSGTYDGAMFEVKKEGRLIEDERATVGLTYTNPLRITEGDQGTVTLTMSPPVPHPVNVGYSISRHRTSTETVGDGGATMADHEVRSGTVTIPNTGTATLDVQTLEDTVPEPEEQFEIVFEVLSHDATSPRYNQINGFSSGKSSETVVVTIVDDDTPESDQRLVYLHGTVSGGLGATRGKLIEGEGKSAELTVTLVGDPPQSDVSIPLKLTGFPANEATSSDYRIPASVTINSGQKSGSVTLQIEDDSLDERFHEFLSVEIDDQASSWPDGYTKGDRSRYEVIMQDNDQTSASLQNLSRAVLTEAAGARTATFQLNIARRPKADPSGTAPFAGADADEGIARFVLGYTGTASRDDDFQVTNIIEIRRSPAALSPGCSPNGEAVTCTVTVTVTDDDLFEGGLGTTESVKIDLDASASLFNDGIARTAGYSGLSLTIEDNDSQPMFSRRGRRAGMRTSP